MNFKKFIVFSSALLSAVAMSSCGKITAKVCVDTGMNDAYSIPMVKDSTTGSGIFIQFVSKIDGTFVVGPEDLSVEKSGQLIKSTCFAGTYTRGEGGVYNLIGNDTDSRSYKLSKKQSKAVGYYLPVSVDKSDVLYFQGTKLKGASFVNCSMKIKD